jgi:hypothetical protein
MRRSLVSGRRLRPRRSYDLHQRLTVMLVCAVATVLFTRAILAASGYPQVGGSKLHIAHVLWGGLLLTAAVVAMLAFLSPAAKPVAAVLGGVGFGLFIDEVGKFVTKDVDYFYRPAIAIIYIAFLVLFAVSRLLARYRFGPDEAVLIAIDSLERSAVGSLSDERRAEALALLRDTGAAGTLADGVAALLDRAPASDELASPTERLTGRLRRLWQALTVHPRFRELVFAVLAAAAAISIAETAWLLRHGVRNLTFSERAFAVTTVVACVLLVIGAFRLVTSVLAALRWYEHAVLLEILVGQVFLFTSEQFEATLDLAALLVVWALIRWGIRFEQNPVRPGPP